MRSSETPKKSDGFLFITDSTFFFNELPRRKQRGIKNFKFCHSALDAESSPVFWIPASAGMTNSPQAAGNTTRRDLKFKSGHLIPL
jgi:hypothetical protein